MPMQIINANLKKCLSSIVVIMIMLSLILIQAPAAQAKTIQTPIDIPPNGTVVLNVVIGGITLPYTWGDITGATGYKFEGMAILDTYLAAEPHETCYGIKLNDLLENIESTLGITLLGDYNLKTVCSDAYTNPAFTVAAAQDYAANHYMLAYKVDDTYEACIGYKDSDPSVTYPATYLRIARNRGGQYTDAFGRDAYMRLISSIQITKSDGSAVELADYLAGFEVMTRKTSTELNKTWTIKLNKEVNSETVAQSVYVTDNNNVVVGTTPSVSADFKSIAVTPTANYTLNKVYRLYISNQLQTKDGQENLNKSLVMPFIINNNETALLQTKVFKVE